MGRHLNRMCPEERYGEGRTEKGTAAENLRAGSLHTETPSSQLTLFSEVFWFQNGMSQNLIPDREYHRVIIVSLGLKGRMVKPWRVRRDLGSANDPG